MSNCVLIQKERLVDLLHAEELLKRLELAGVDNWSSYSEAISGENDGLVDYYEIMCSIKQSVINTTNNTLFEGNYGL